MKPCPFCHKDTELVMYQWPFNPMITSVKCLQCGAFGPYGNDNEDAINQGNNRGSEPFRQDFEHLWEGSEVTI